MKTWRLYGPGGRFALEEEAVPEPRPGGAVIRMEAAPVLSYLRQVLDGSLGYALPRKPFVPGTNGIGVVEAIGSGVYHLKRGQRVSISPHHVADERAANPAQILIGLTATAAARFHGLEAATLALQQDWADGVLAEYALMPAACATPIDGLDRVPPERLAALGKLTVPYGGFLRGRLQPGETVIVNGASGYFGSAGVLVALAMGAARVIAAGRDRAALEAVAAAGGARVHPVPLSGDAEADADALSTAGGAIDLALDLVGRATSANSTLACLRALRRRGRLVLMGSMSVPLPLAVGEMLGNDWEVIGNFMYPKEAPARLIAMMAAGTLSLDPIVVRRFPLTELSAAMDAAAGMRALDLTVVTMG